MNKRLVAGLSVLSAGVVLASASISGSSSIPSQQPQPGEWMIEFDQAKGMEAWMQSMEPSKFHNFLARFVGDWDVEFQIYMQAGAEPMKSKGTAKIYWQFPGKWLAQDNKASFMGQVMNSFSLTGYDNVKRQFVGTLVDSMSTEMKSFKGGLSPDGKVLTMYGEMDEPITGENAKMVKYQTFITDGDHHVLEVSEILYGEPWVVVRIEYTRKSDG